MKIHLGVHSDGKPSNCDQCEIKFRSLGDIKSLLQLHSGEKTFKCSDCEKDFFQLVI